MKRKNSKVFTTIMSLYNIGFYFQTTIGNYLPYMVALICFRRLNAVYYSLIVLIAFEKIMQRKDRMFPEVWIAFVNNAHVHDYGYAVTLTDAVLYFLVSVAKNANQAHKITFQIQKAGRVSSSSRTLVFFPARLGDWPPKIYSRKKCIEKSQ